MADIAGDLIVCPHVLDGFKEGYLVCQVDTDKGKLDVATCRSCILEIVDGNQECFETYTTITKQRAATPGVVIANRSDQPVPADPWRAGRQTLN
jgi:hypothetical protein